jgi:hypothetical protein
VEEEVEEEEEGEEEGPVKNDCLISIFIRFEGRGTFEGGFEPVAETPKAYSYSSSLVISKSSSITYI